MLSCKYKLNNIIKIEFIKEMYMREIFDFIVLFLIYIFVFYRKWKVQGKDVLFINTIMYIYLSFVLYFTLMPILVSLPFIFNHPYDPFLYN